MRDAPILAATQSLHDLYDAANARFYGGHLPPVALTIQTKGKMNAYGWCSADERWRDEPEREKLREVNISAEYLARPFDDVLGTLLHEMVHVYHFHNGISGVSRGGRYHNVQFRDDANARGLQMEKHPTHGWTLTYLSDSGRAFLYEQMEHAAAFRLFRNEATTTPGTRRKPTWKHTCTSCGLVARTNVQATLRCEACDEVMDATQ